MLQKVTVYVRFEIEGTEGESLVGAACCVVHPGTSDRYTSYGWVRGDAAEVEIISVVVEDATVVLYGLPFRLEFDCEPFCRLSLAAREKLEVSDKFLVDALDAANEVIAQKIAERIERA